MTAAHVESSPAHKGTLDWQTSGSRSISSLSLHAVPYSFCKIGGSEIHSELCRVLSTALDDQQVVPGVGYFPRFHPPTNTLPDHRVYLHFHAASNASPRKYP